MPSPLWALPSAAASSSLVPPLQLSAPALIPLERLPCQIPLCQMSAQKGCRLAGDGCHVCLAHRGPQARSTAFRYMPDSSTSSRNKRLPSSPAASFSLSPAPGKSPSPRGAHSHPFAVSSHQAGALRAQSRVCGPPQPLDLQGPTPHEQTRAWDSITISHLFKPLFPQIVSQAHLHQPERLFDFL